MIALCTGSPTAEYGGVWVVISAPSGQDTAQIALNLSQCEFLIRDLREAADIGWKAMLAPKPEAEVIAFPRPKRA